MQDINNINIDLNLLLNYFWDYITFEMVLKFIVVYFLIVWIAMIVWVLKDITNRTNSIILQTLSILIIVFLTPFGIFIYLLIRPSRTLFENYYYEIEDNLDIIADFIEERTKNKNDNINFKEIIDNEKSIENIGNKNEFKELKAEKNKDKKNKKNKKS